MPRTRSALGYLPKEGQERASDYLAGQVSEPACSRQEGRQAVRPGVPYGSACLAGT